MTSSHSIGAQAEAGTPNFMVSFKRPQVRRCRDGSKPSPGHRRLRFSFQINDVKDPPGFPNPPYEARRRRGAAYLATPNSVSTGSFKLSVFFPGFPGSGDAKPAPGPLGMSQAVQRESVKGAEDSLGPVKKQELKALRSDGGPTVRLSTRANLGIGSSPCKRSLAPFYAPVNPNSRTIQS